MRGQLLKRTSPLCQTRIIPARAGPTDTRNALDRYRTDHPRSCGANCLSAINAIEHSGSSPLVRGQHARNSATSLRNRIIPARAGPTSFMSIWTVYSTDHPRSCGANLWCWWLFCCSFGSSPLVRGQHLVRGDDGDFERIIPARAGPTHQCRPVPPPVEDHPRSCGANFVHVHMDSLQHGSSPLVRGQPTRSRACPRTARIIPARAGPTAVFLLYHICNADHPRSCGANSLILRGKSGLSQIKIFDYSSGIWQ